MVFIFAESLQILLFPLSIFAYSSCVKLTDQQTAIVQHLQGPALVFAVAGAGKTTCMVHRIHHLIARKVCRPGEILATSFSTATVGDLVAQLVQLGVPVGIKNNGVDCRTLHSLGFRVIRGAVRRGYLDRRWLQANDAEGAGSRLIHQTLTRMAIEDGVAVYELNLDREDLQNQIAIWKGNLMYADLDAASLPAAALKFAKPAVHPNEQYLRAYRLYEQLRREQGIITFDDMLQTGWELLLRYPDILQAARGHYRSIMVDEFQDVNYAQYLILDLLAQPHRNYMAIGDDDQCIYEWRGAIPAFILHFEKTYGAKVFTISDNFRSRAQQIILANAVIAHNRTRYPKFLSLTRGFEGETHLVEQKDDWAIARHITAEVLRRERQGASPADMAVLIRLYSQTAFLETVFIDQQIPYEIVGGEPFFKRTEAVPLFQYLSFALLEQVIHKKGFPEDPAQVTKYLDMFANIINRPRRYISRDNVAAAVTMARRTRRSVIEVLGHQKEGFPGRVQEKVEQFAELIRLLILRLNRPAHKVLRWLVHETGYENHLLNASGRREMGLARVQNIEALIAFAHAKNLRCRAFLDYLREISLHPIPNPRNLPPLKIMTIYKAKGLEWDTVFVPGCYEGLAPCIVAEDGVNEDVLRRAVEAERRLFYVAITRARHTLFLYYTKKPGMTPFLQDSHAVNLLENVERLRTVWQRPPRRFREADVIWLCRVLGAFHLARYLTHWNPLPAAVCQGVKPHLAALEAKIRAAETAVREYEQRLAACQEAQTRSETARQTREKQLRQMPVLIRQLKSAYYPLEPGIELHCEELDDGNVIVLSGQGMAGMIDFDEMPKLDRAAVHWERSSVTVRRLRSDTLIEAKFTRLVLDRAHLAGGAPVVPKPEPPPEAQRRFLEPNLRRGVEILKKSL